MAIRAGGKVTDAILSNHSEHIEYLNHLNINL
jgi:hypothetical protein